MGRRLLHLHKFCEQIKLLCRRRNSHHCPPGQVAEYHFAFVLEGGKERGREGKREGERKRGREYLSTDFGLLLN